MLMKKRTGQDFDVLTSTFYVEPLGLSSRQAAAEPVSRTVIMP